MSLNDNPEISKTWYKNNICDVKYLSDKQMNSLGEYDVFHAKWRLMFLWSVWNLHLLWQILGRMNCFLTNRWVSLTWCFPIFFKVILVAFSQREPDSMIFLFCRELLQIYFVYWKLASQNVEQIKKVGKRNSKVLLFSSFNYVTNSDSEF